VLSFNLIITFPNGKFGDYDTRSNRQIPGNWVFYSIESERASGRLKLSAEGDTDLPCRFNDIIIHGDGLHPANGFPYWDRFHIPPYLRSRA
jgi:hypothetical protein